MAILLGLLSGAAALGVYFIIEKRINQRACLSCGYNISADAIEEQCPRCDALLSEDTED
jgi:Zn finger protein HypA/HybF involved in hydrogenase expression